MISGKLLIYNKRPSKEKKKRKESKRVQKQHIHSQNNKKKTLYVHMYIFILNHLAPRVCCYLNQNILVAYVFKKKVCVRLFFTLRLFIRFWT